LPPSAAAALPPPAAAAAVPPQAAAAAAPEGPGPLSVSEPDLRGVLVAGPAAVEQAHPQEGAAGGLRHRGSLDSAGPAGGLTGLLSSSMHYLFHRSGSSQGDGSSSTTTGGTGSPVSSPPPGSGTP
jgi:hypothetical protein